MTRPFRPLRLAAVAVLSAGAAVATVTPVAATAPPDDVVFGTVTVTGAPLPDLNPSVQSGDVADPAVGVPVPVVSGADYDGRPVTIDPATQGPTLVVLISHWCPHCNVMVDRLAEWRRASEAPKALRIVGISVGADPTQENFPPAEWLETDADWRWPVIADDAVSTGLRAYGGSSFPMFVFVAGDGTMAWRTTGEQPMEVLAERIAESLAAEPA